MGGASGYFADQLESAALTVPIDGQNEEGNELGMKVVSETDDPALGRELSGGDTNETGDFGAMFTGIHGDQGLDSRLC